MDEFANAAATTLAHLSHRERSDGFSDPGEGLRTNDRPYPLTPTLSPWERERIATVETFVMQMNAPQISSISARDDLRTEHRLVRGVIVAIAVMFLTVFVVLPLVVVFAQAFSKGIGAYFAALSDPEALSAIRLTLMVAGDFGRPQPGIRTDGGLGDRQVRFSRQDLADFADRSAVLRQPGDLGSGFRAAVRRAGVLGAMAAGAQHPCAVRGARHRAGHHLRDVSVRGARADPA